MNRGNTMDTIVFEKEINDLEFYFGNEDQGAEVTLSVINRLRDINEKAKSAEWTNEELTALNFNDSDPLDTQCADDLPEAMKEDIRQIQHGIINYYGS